MKTPWFRKTGAMNWIPASREGWLVLMLWVVLGPVMGESFIFGTGAGPTQTLVGVTWILFSIFALVIVIRNNDDQTT